MPRSKANQQTFTNFLYSSTPSHPELVASIAIMNGMDHNFSSPVPGHPQIGYWSPQTSAANFCEIDYEYTHYIAELINTLSNLAYIWQGVVTLPKNLRGSGRELQLWKWPVENLALLLVGLGSGAFHATLLHEMQILDESGMYALVGALDYRLWSAGMTDGTNLLFGTVLGGLIAGVIGWNAVGTSDGKASNVIHLLLFIGLLTALWPRVLYMIRKERDIRRSQGQKGQDATARRLMREFRMGVVFFFSGFAIWIIDGKFCDQLRDFRAFLGPPGAWYLEGHGWWHFLTALGAGNFVRVVRELTEEKAIVKKEHGNGHIKTS